MRWIIAILAVLGIADLLVLNLVAVPRFLEERERADETTALGVASASTVPGGNTGTVDNARVVPRGREPGLLASQSIGAVARGGGTNSSSPAVEEPIEDSSAGPPTEASGRAVGERPARSVPAAGGGESEPRPRDTSGYRPRPILFASNAASLTVHARQQLDELHDFVDHSNTKLMIRGHADSRGEEDENLGLSRRRAETVVGYLVERGVARGRIEVEWLGESEPTDARDNPNAWALNRRVEILIR